MKILYMGTPYFAVKPLEALIKAGHNIVGVFTQPDKPKGRGMKMTLTPVKECAISHEIPVFQPETMKNYAVQEIIDKLQPELIAVVAYGKVLPGYVLRYPKYGCVNVHGSLLPKYRGAAPIQWAVINGEKTTGVTTMFMARGIDTGDMLLKEELEIGESDTAETMYENLSQIGADLLVKTVCGLCEATIERIPQDSTKATFAPMLTKEDAKIDWNKSAQQIINLARGTTPWPGVYGVKDDEAYKLFNIKMGENICERPSGSVLAITKEGIEIVCGDKNTVIAAQIQAPGKKRMLACDYFRGHAVFDHFD